MYLSARDKIYFPSFLCHCRKCTANKFIFQRRTHIVFVYIIVNIHLCFIYIYFFTQFTCSIFVGLCMRISWKSHGAARMAVTVWKLQRVWSVFLPFSFSQHNTARFSGNLIRRAGGWKSLMFAIAKVCTKTVNYAQSYFCLTNISIEQHSSKMSLVRRKRKCVFSCAPLSRVYERFIIIVMYWVIVSDRISKWVKCQLRNRW